MRVVKGRYRASRTRPKRHYLFVFPADRLGGWLCDGNDHRGMAMLARQAGRQAALASTKNLSPDAAERKALVIALALVLTASQTQILGLDEDGSITVDLPRLADAILGAGYRKHLPAPDASS